jgi:hypothetical protein
MLAEKELATVGRMADGRLFVSRVDLLHAYVHALAIARQVKEYLGGTTNTGTADGDTSSNLSFSPRLVEDLFNALLDERHAAAEESTCLTMPLAPCTRFVTRIPMFALYLVLMFNVHVYCV